ncbi:MAG: adenosylmethionine--8-amino-7-oxononanoate transaminase [Chloroflexi bacterium]|nr:adenosylmethionine--8-amino-7-oxononanoate transaminase [Chloroflexota bacterium]
MTDEPNWEQLDKELVWHPFTQMGDWLQEKPLVIAAGEGSYLVDVEGRRYLDGVSSLWVTVHGHRRREIDEAIIAQLGRVAHSTFLGLSHQPAIELARKLVSLSPAGLTKVFYSDNGSTAVEVALKMAFQYLKQRPGPEPVRNTFISFVNGYHGDTIGSVSVGGIDLFHRIYRPLLFSTVQAPSAYCYRCYLDREYPDCGMTCLGDVEDVIRKNRDKAAAVVMEPLVQAAGGMIVYPQGYTRHVRDLAAQYGLFFIADEVATGFGRTGTMFACQQEGIEPDFMAAAKGITGGYLPLAATLTTKRVFDAFCGEYRDKITFFHGHTYTANPLACAAAIANLEIFEKERTLEKLRDKVFLLNQELQEFRRLRHVGDVRQLGFMVGIELVKDPDTKEEYPYEDKMGIRVIQEARKRGLIIRPLENVIVLMPPLGISGPELEQLLQITFESIRSVTEGG